MEILSSRVLLHPSDLERSRAFYRDADAARAELSSRGVPITREPRREPWGLIEMWIEDPDGVAICVVQIPEDHPMRSRGMPAGD